MNEQPISSPGYAPDNMPQIFKLMSAIMADIGAVPQLGQMKHDGNYPYHRLKDILAHVHAALVKHQVFIIPRVLERTFGERTTKSGVVYKVVYLTVAYRFYAAADGSYVESLVESEGEDNGDKATLKAMSFALKTCLCQAFAIPAEDLVDGDDTRAEETVRQQGNQQNARRGNLKAVDNKDGEKRDKEPPAAASGDGKKDETSQLSEAEVDELLTKALQAFRITTEEQEIEAVKTHLKLKQGLPRKDWDLGLKRAMLTKLRAERDRRKAAKQTQGQQTSATQ